MKQQESIWTATKWKWIQVIQGEKFKTKEQYNYSENKKGLQKTSQQRKVN